MDLNNMQKIITELPTIKLVGITTRTNNKQLFESDPATNKVAATVQKYFHGALSDKIPHRKNPGVTYCVYTEYETDHNGDFTYFIGEQVSTFDHLPEGFISLTIPAQTYAKFTNGPAPMPMVCIDMWQKIWKMDNSQLGGTRGYRADFELYDERASDHNKVTLDLFIGI